MRTPSFRPWFGKTFLLAALACLLLPTGALAQGRVRWAGSGGWSQSGPYLRLYNTNTLVTIRGSVDRVETFRPERGMSPGVQMVVRTDSDLLTVHLGPHWHVERQDLELRPKEQVAVEGSRVTVDGKPVVLAARVMTRDGTLVLRNAEGVPAWSGGLGTMARRAGLGTSWVLQLPEGSVERGKTAFRDLWCHACHVAKGHESAFPAPYAQPPVPVVLGAEARKPNRLDLVNSLINPSHRLEPGFQKELVSAGKYSRMGDYNETMTLQQLSDLVAFLESLPR